MFMIFFFIVRQVKENISASLINPMALSGMSNTNSLFDKTFAEYRLTFKICVENPLNVKCPCGESK